MASEKVYNVVVTAAANFRGNINHTSRVKDAMPDRIERDGHVPIRVIKLPHNFLNTIADMDNIPPLWNRDRRVYDPDCQEGDKIYINAMVHMGINFGYDWGVERQTQRDGYDWTGDDGLPLPKHNGDKGGRWEGLPEILKTAVDVDEIVEQLHKDLPDLPTRASSNPGKEYCAFIYYTSLAELYRREETARALFLHIPGKKAAEEDIKDSVRVATTVICSMIDQLESAGLAQ